MIYHIGTQNLETPQAILRRITLDDAEDMFRNWASDPEVTRYLTWHPHQDISVSKEIISSWLEELKSDSCYKWCIQSKESGQVIGSIDIVHLDEHLECATMGYCLSRAYWGKGIMTESLIAVEDFLFAKVGLNRVEACHHVDNPASGRVMQKSGMKFEGIKRHGIKDNQGRFCDIAVYAILKSDWIEQGRG